MPKKKISKQISRYMSKIGKKGGMKTGPTKARSPEQARAAINARWEKKKSSQGEQNDEEGD